MTLLSGRPLRRRVLYIPGYAPVGLDSQRRLFARETARFATLWGVEAEVSAIDPADRYAAFASFLATTRMPGGVTVETCVEVLRWDDLVAADFRTAVPLKLGRGLATLWDGVISGTLWRVARAAPWFALAWIYPYLVLLLCVAAGAAAGLVVAGVGSTALGVPAGLAVAGLALAGLRRTPLFVFHLLDDWISQRRYIHRRDPAMDQRLKDFAARIVDAVSRGDADEVLVVGHSSGSFLAIDVVAQAFETDPKLGARGTPLSLLTLGAAELLIALHPAAGWFRDRLARLARERSLYWVEIVGRWDTLNFAERDPVAELGLASQAERPNPRFRRVALRRLLTEATVNRLARRLNVFRIHFQYVMANELQGPYDFFALIYGAGSVRAQFGRFSNSQPMSPFPITGTDCGGLRGS